MPFLDVAPDELRRLLVGEGRTLTEVAQRFGVSIPTVANRARGLGIASMHSRVRRLELHEGDWLRGSSSQRAAASTRSPPS